MAGNKPTAKIKGNKEERIKGKKNVDVYSNSCDGSSSGSPNQSMDDLSILHKSIPTSIVGFRQIKNAYESATDEVRNLLSNECDFIYECRVCRNMFRSLANFLSHKRIYCQQKFNTTLHAHFIATSFLDGDTTNVYANNNNNEECSSKANLNNNKKDLTSIIHKLGQQVNKRKLGLLDYYNEMSYRVEQQDALTSEHGIRLDKIDSNKSAVYQTIVKKDDCDTNNEFILDEVIELHDMLWKDNAVLGPDGKLLALDSSGQIISPKCITSKFSDEEDEVLKCDICCLEFKTRKTLLYHIKVRHSTSHMHYPCPSCNNIFPTAGSVYKHLCKVHNNTMITVRKLRDQILNKGFTMDNASKRMLNRMSKQGENAAIKSEVQDENETWMYDLELDGDALCCTGCSRKFERKAALTSHQLICKSRAQLQSKQMLNLIKKTDENGTEKPQKTSRKTKAPSKKVKPIKIETQSSVETGVENLTRSDDSHESSEIENELNKVEKSKVNENELVFDPDANNDIKKNRRKRALTTKIIDKTKENFNDLYWEINNQGSLDVKRPKIESNEEEEMKRKMFSLINEKQMQCIPCKRVFPSMTNLKRHIALHMKWKRFQCGLCCAQFYHRSECVYHLGRSHNMMGDKIFADTLIIPIQHKDSESCLDKEVNNADEEIINKSLENKIKQPYDMTKDNIDLAIEDVIFKYTDMEIIPKEQANHDDVENNISNKFDSNEFTNKDEIHSASSQEIMDETTDLAPVKKRGRPKLSVQLDKMINDEDDNREKRGRGRPRGSINKEKKRKVKKRRNSVESPSSQEPNAQPQDPEKMRKMVLEVIFGGEKTDDKPEETVMIKNEQLSSPDTDVSCASTDFEIKTKIDNTTDRRNNRPVRNRVKVVNKDFVYDLSDLLKKEAEAYKENQYTSACNKFKKKSNSVSQLENSNIKLNDNLNYENDNIISESITPCINPTTPLEKIEHYEQKDQVIDEPVSIMDQSLKKKSVSGKNFNKENIVISTEGIEFKPQDIYKADGSVDDITVIPINVTNNSIEDDDESSSSSDDEMPRLEVNTMHDSNDENQNDSLETSESDSSSDSDSSCPDITENTYKLDGSPPTIQYVNSSSSKNVFKIQQNNAEIPNQVNKVYIRRPTGNLQEVVFESPESNEHVYQPLVNGVTSSNYSLEYSNDNGTESVPLECDSTLEESSSEDDSYDSDN